LENGKSLADIATSNGKSVDGLVNAMVADAKRHLDEVVSEGGFTQAQATEMLSHLEQGIRAMVEGTPPQGLPGPAFGFRHVFEGGFSDGPPSFDGA
jgi:hypothetical protein